MPPENVITGWSRRSARSTISSICCMRAGITAGSIPYSSACRRRFWSAVSWLSSVESWKTRPMWRRTLSRAATTSKPLTRAAPAVGFASVQSMLIVVLLPAPLGPRKPNTSPGGTVKETPLTASISPKDFPSSSTSIAGGDVEVMAGTVTVQSL